MATIKERAKAYHLSIIVKNPAAEAWGLDTAYIKGATEQRKVDIEKACKFVREICDGKKESNWKYDWAEQLKEYMNH